MPRSAVIKTIELTANWRPLATSALLLPLSIAVPHSVSAELRIGGGTGIELNAGQAAQFDVVDWARVEVRGTPGAKILAADARSLSVADGPAAVPPTVVSAVHNKVEGTLTVTFSSPLPDAEAVDCGNFELMVQSVFPPIKTYVGECGGGMIVGGVLYLFVSAGGFQAGGLPRMSYFATPAALVGANGAPVAAFTDHAITTV